jgi:2-dehydropantoate 2-reductase
VAERTVLLIGAGPVGRLVALDFAARANPEIRICWLIRDRKPRNELATNGLRAVAAGDSNYGERLIRPADVGIEIDSPETAWSKDPGIEPDAVITCVKAFALGELASRVSSRWPSAPLLAISNGLIETDRHCLGVLYGGGRIQDGVLIYTPSPKLNIGVPYPMIAHHSILDIWRDLFGKAGVIDIHLSESNHRAMLEKVLVNSVINPLTALFASPNEIILTEKLSNLVSGLVAEICATFNASYEGYDFKPEIEVSRVREIASTTALNFSSMLEDVRSGRRTEIAWLNGKIAELADAAGIPAPINKLVCDLVPMAAYAAAAQAHSIGV